MAEKENILKVVLSCTTRKAVVKFQVGTEM